MTCRNCGTELLDSAKFCVSCGTKVTADDTAHLCPNCGGEPEAGANFCLYCGHDLRAHVPQNYPSGKMEQQIEEAQQGRVAEAQAAQERYRGNEEVSSRKSSKSSKSSPLVRLGVLSAVIVVGLIAAFAHSFLNSASPAPQSAPASPKVASSPSPASSPNSSSLPAPNSQQQGGSSAGSEQTIYMSHSPSPSPSDSESSQSSTSKDPALSSPEDALKAYAQGLTDKDYSRLKKIYPSESTDRIRSWVEGENGLAPLTTVTVVGKPERDETSPNKVTLWATLQYCTDERGNKTSRDSRDSKYYTFVNNQGIWQLESMTTPENIVRISC